MAIIGAFTTQAVSEIKGAPCTRRAHFHGRVHDFRRCGPGVRTFFELFIIAIYWEGAWRNSWVQSFRGSAPCECTKWKLNFGHCQAYTGSLKSAIADRENGTESGRAPWPLMRMGTPPPPPTPSTPPPPQLYLWATVPARSDPSTLRPPASQPTRSRGGGAGTPTHCQCAATLHCWGFPHSLPDHQLTIGSFNFLPPSHPAPFPLAFLPLYPPLCAPSHPIEIVDVV